MSVEIFSSADHKCVVFPDLVRGEDGVQANQFLVVHGKHSALIDPGGALLYTPLNLAMSRYVQPRELTYILASHQDPDVIGSVDRWLLYSDCSIVCSKLWGRFIPHSVPHYQKGAGGDRYMLVPDEGMDIPMGDIKLRALPAHSLHSVGNLSFYDPYSKILFSGDIGASLIAAGTAYEPVEDFTSLVGRMEGFHRRYMASNRVTRLWVRMVRQLPIDMIVPQHGLPMKGKAVADFLSAAFVIGSALGAVAGVMVGSYYEIAHYQMGFMLCLKAFTAAVLGGIGNLGGAMAGGILLGLIEVLGAGYIGDLTGGFLGSHYPDILAFIVLIVVLMFKPSCRFGEKTGDRA